MQNEQEEKLFLDGFIKTDNKKNLYIKTNNQYKLITVLKKSIYSAVIYENLVFLMDSFGDCFLVVNNSFTFLFGILSPPQHFSVCNGRVYALDKYCRMWIHDLEGEILNIAFLKENILGVLTGIKNCLYITDGKKAVLNYTNYEPNFKVSEIEKKKPEIIKDEKKYKIYIVSRSFDLLEEINCDKIVESSSKEIQFIANGKLEKLAIECMSH